jgi:hypothetical protein
MNDHYHDRLDKEVMIYQLKCEGVDEYGTIIKSDFKQWLDENYGGWDSSEVSA